MNPLRFGIVGCGTISGTHGDALTKLKEEGLAQFVAATDIVPDRAHGFAARYGGEAVESYAALLARPDIDVVTLCTPSGLHGQMTVQAAQAGKHILCEKPLDVWIEAADAGIAAAKAAGVTLGGIFMERFSPAARKIKRAIEAGAFGEIVLACAETKWYRTQGYYDSGDWRGTWALDAGVFSNQGIHSLDKVQWLAGPVAEVLSATLKPGFHRNIEGETLGVVTVRFENGALGTLTMTTLTYEGFPERVDISGIKGSAMLVGDHLAHFATQEPFEADQTEALTTASSAPEKNTSSDPAALSGDGHFGNIRDFVLAIHEGRQPYVSAESARHAVKLLNMIYEKAQVGPYALRKPL
jgi:UDP-N-acetyl-2-amino-2-deoxyglucuronate dehydrogenase